MSTRFNKTLAQLRDEREFFKARAKELWKQGFRRDVIAEKLGIKKSFMYSLLRGEKLR